MVGSCDIVFLNFHHCKVQNFESVQKKLKFYSQLLKALKAKVKANEVHQNSIKAKYYTIKFVEISFVS